MRPRSDLRRFDDSVAEPLMLAAKALKKEEAQLSRASFLTDA